MNQEEINATKAHIKKTHKVRFVSVNISPKFPPVPSPPPKKTTKNNCQNFTTHCCEGPLHAHLHPPKENPSLQHYHPGLHHCFLHVTLILYCRQGEVEIDDDDLSSLEVRTVPCCCKYLAIMIFNALKLKKGYLFSSARYSQNSVKDNPELKVEKGLPDSNTSSSTLLLDTTDEHRIHLFDLNCRICTGKMAPPGEPPRRETPAPLVSTTSM